MKDESSWTRFKQGVSHDFQQGVHRLSPAGVRALQWLGDASKGRITRLRPPPWRTVPLPFKAILLLIATGILVLLIIEIPRWQAARWEGRIELKEVAKQESDTRATIVQALGGLALLAGLLFTWRNLRMTEQNSRHTLDLSRKGQINDRFVKATEQLGAVDQGGGKKLEVRLGGIYALEQVAKDSPDDHHWPIMEILTAYVREHAPWKETEQRSKEGSSTETPPTQNHESLPKPTTDVQAILTVIGRRTRTYGKGEDHPLNLTYTDLRGGYLPEAHLEGALLFKSHLERACLAGAHLERAQLGEAHLEGAVLLNAHLTDANLDGAYLTGASIQGACVKGAILSRITAEGFMEFTPEQLFTVRSFLMAKLDLRLQQYIQQHYPHLPITIEDELRRLSL
jgi:hypothetical protein